MSEKARALLRKLRSERNHLKTISYSAEKTKEIGNKFLLKLTKINNQKEEKIELDPLTYFDKKRIKITPMNVNEYIHHSDNESEEEIIKRSPIKKMRHRLVNNPIENFNLNIKDILQAKKNLVKKTELDVKEMLRKDEEQLKKEHEKRIERINNSKNVSKDKDDMSFQVRNELIKEIKKEFSENENLENENNNDLKNKCLSPNRINRLEMRLKKARKQYVEIYRKKQKLNLGEDIIRKAKDLEEKINIPKELVCKIHEILESLKLPEKCIIDDEVSILNNDSYNYNKPSKKLTKDELLFIMTKDIKNN